MTTIKDIAKALNVSPSTVSKALNNKPGVNPELRRKIITLAEEMDYRRVLSLSYKNFTHTIGIIVSDISNPFFANIVLSIEKVLYSRNYKYILSNTDENPERETDYLQALINNRVDGLIVAPSNSLKVDEKRFKLYKSFIANGGTVVFIDRIIEGLDTSYVIIDNFGAAFETVKYLKDKGHKKIGAVIGLENVFTSRERFKGFMEAVKIYGLEVKKEWILNGNYTVEGSKKAILKLFKSSNLPTALISFNNVMTLGVLKAFKELKVRIPEDISLISFDDAPWNEFNEVPITSIVQPVEEIGTIAATVLLGKLENFKISKRNLLKPSRIVLKSYLLERSSVRTINSSSQYLSKKRRS